MSIIASFERALLHALSPQGKRARLLILTFHRVVPRPDPLLPEEPDAARFAAQMDILSTYCRVLPLPEAVRRLRSGELPPRAAAITFDDGYANNLDVALPILEARGMTATIFIAVDAIRRGIMWNDLVIEAVRAAERVVDTADSGLPPIDLATTPRAAAVNLLLDKLKYLPLEQRWALASELQRVNARAAAPRLMLQETQISAIAQRGHDLGAHTVNHPILKELAPEEAEHEIRDSGRWLQEVTGRVPRSFAYPNGRPQRDYDASHAAMVKAAGFELAVSTAWGCAGSGSDVYQLPRCAPWAMESKLFPLRLAKLYMLDRV
jgi:peptidoglycan/xylan/chitin deacetylase (PgdA/CDA1 family)